MVTKTKTKTETKIKPRDPRWQYGKPDRYDVYAIRDRDGDDVMYAEYTQGYGWTDDDYTPSGACGRLCTMWAAPKQYRRLAKDEQERPCERVRPLTIVIGRLGQVIMRAVLPPKKRKTK
jgi:hypothetical protein